MTAGLRAFALGGFRAGRAGAQLRRGGPAAGFPADGGGFRRTGPGDAVRDDRFFLHRDALRPVGQGFGTFLFFFAGHLAQQALGILIDVHETGDDPDDQEDQLQPGTRLQPGVESVAYGETHQRAFRNKMEFAFGPADGSGLCLGLRRRGGLRVLPVPGCALPPGEGLELVTACADLAARSGLPAYVPPRSAAEEGRLRPRAEKNRGRRPRRERPATEDCGFWRFLVVRYGWPDPAPAQAAADDAPGRRWWLTCVTSPGTAEQRRTVARLGRELLDAVPCVQAFVHEERATPDALVAGETRVLCLDRRGDLPDDGAPLYLPLGGRWFGIDPASFFQVNSRAAELLAATAVDLLLSPQAGVTPRRLLDVYCGAGAPGLLAAGHFDEVLGMEYDRRAVLLAERNARRFGFGHCRYEAGDAARLLTALARKHGPGHWDHALLDPPRGGVAPEALEALLPLAPERLVYISCNPAPLARDARMLSADYELVQVTPLDLFPHSPHVESVSCWQRRA